MVRGRKRVSRVFCVLWGILFLVVAPVAGVAQTTCPEESPLINHQGGGMVTCPCFAVGEEAGAVFEAPMDHYPIEILRVGIGWGSQFGGAPQSLEDQIRIYEGGLPNPGVPIAQLSGPVLTDGFINEFDLEPLPGDILINSGPFTVTLRFAVENAAMLFSPSMVHDGAGCVPGRNVVNAIPGGWNDACALGVSGNWVVQVVYRRVNCGSMDPEFIRGACNGDSMINIADAITLLGFLFPGGGTPVTLLCLDACDANDDGSIDIADAVALLNSLFGSPAVPLPEPSSGCGPDVGVDMLTCDTSATCP